MTRTKTLIAALAATALTAHIAAAAPPAPWTYPAHPPAEPVRPSEGWGLSASLSGHTLDLGDYGAGWALDPNVASGERSAGLNWRSSQSSVVLGYHELSADRWAPPAPTAWEIRSQDEKGVLGFSVVLRSH